MFAALHNLTGPDPYAVNDLGQECRTSLANEGPTVVLGCSADASGAESCIACNGLNTHASGAEWCVHGWMDWRLIGVNYTVHPSQSQLRTQPEARGLVRKA